MLASGSAMYLNTVGAALFRVTGTCLKFITYVGELLRPWCTSHWPQLRKGYQS